MKPRLPYLVLDANLPERLRADLLAIEYQLEDLEAECLEPRTSPYEPDDAPGLGAWYRADPSVPTFPEDRVGTFDLVTVPTADGDVPDQENQQAGTWPSIHFFNQLPNNSVGSGSEAKYQALNVTRTAYVGPTQMDCFMLVRPSGWSSQNNGVWGLDTDNGFFLNASKTLRWTVAGQTLSVAWPSAFSDAWHLIELYRREDLGVLLVDGVVVGALTCTGTSAAGTGTLSVGWSNSGGISGYLEGWVSELAFFPAALATEWRGHMLDYFAQRYDLLLPRNPEL